MSLTHYEGPAARMVALNDPELEELGRLLTAMPTADNGALRRKLARELTELRKRRT